MMEVQHGIPEVFGLTAKQTNHSLSSIVGKNKTTIRKATARQLHITLFAMQLVKPLANKCYREPMRKMQSATLTRANSLGVTCYKLCSFVYKESPLLSKDCSNKRISSNLSEKKCLFKM